MIVVHTGILIYSRLVGIYGGNVVGNADFEAMLINRDTRLV